MIHDDQPEPVKITYSHEFTSLCEDLGGHVLDFAGVLQFEVHHSHPHFRELWEMLCADDERTVDSAILFLQKIKELTP